MTTTTTTATVRQSLPVEVLRVASTSHVPATAGAIAGCLRSAGQVRVECIGAAALNQAIKATIVARGYLAHEGADCTCAPDFFDAECTEGERTGIRLLLTRVSGA